MKKAYIIGIEGAGTSALAVLFRRLGYEVSGSDNGDHFYAEALRNEGIPVYPDYDQTQVPKDADIVVYSTAFEGNVEVEKSRELGLKTLSYPEAVALLFNDALGVAVAGTHGKTTTSAMLAHVLSEIGLDPTAIIGGRVRGWNGNALFGSGKHFVLEADEYQNKLRFYEPFSVILTSVDWDHPDFFPTVAEYESAFSEFVRRIPKHGVLVFCNDSSSVTRIASEAKCGKLSYGFHDGSDVRIVAYEPVSSEESGPDGPRQRFEVFTQGESLGTFSLRLAGRHNARNASSVIALASFLKIDMEKVREALASFSGTERRFEYVGSRGSVPVFDDYAHHPEEIRATLSAFRDLYPRRRIVAVFHPHTFSRTEALLPEFAQSFDVADRVFLLEVYGSARERTGTVSSVDLVDGINRYAPGKAEFVRDIDGAVSKLSGILEDNDLLVTLGAGDVWKVAKQLVESESVGHPKPIS